MSKVCIIVKYYSKVAIKAISVGDVIAVVGHEKGIVANRKLLEIVMMP